MTPVEHDRAYGRRLARNGLRLTRSDHAPYAWERLAAWREAQARVPLDSYCTVAGVPAGPRARTLPRAR